jgi:aryl-alcohol dehydrogenase-like predicted oxidoreductase
VGEWFARTGKRKDIFLATKFGFVKGDPNYATRSDAEFCKNAIEASLKELQTDYIDLCKFHEGPPQEREALTNNVTPDYCHHPDPKTPIEETMRAMVELQK